MFHYRMFYRDGNTAGIPFDATRMPAFQILWPFYAYGDLAVQMFWCLSGFVFALQYLDKPPPSARHFFVWRFSRLYPLHLATLLLIVVIQFAAVSMMGSPVVNSGYTPLHFFLQLFMANNWAFLRDYSFNAPIWSVSVEVIIYLVFLAFLRFGSRGLLPTLALIILFAVLATVLEYAVATCGLLFFVGVLIRQLLKLTQGWRFRTALGFSTAPFAVALAVTSYALRPGFVDILLMYLVIPSVLLAVATLDTVYAPLAKRWHWIGDTTYATYLIHFPLILATVFVMRASGIADATLDGPWILPIYVLVVIGLAIPVFYWFERPMQRAIRSAWA